VDDVTNLHLVLDEIVSNIIRHGGGADADRHVDVSLAVNGDRVTVDVVDNGVAFDPLVRPGPNLDLPIAQRPIGGLGIHIVKALSETIAYHRDDGRNHLTLTMILGRSGD